MTKRVSPRFGFDIIKNGFIESFSIIMKKLIVRSYKDVRTLHNSSSDMHFLLYDLFIYVGYHALCYYENIKMLGVAINRLPRKLRGQYG